jgi:hypothetical protein
MNSKKRNLPFRGIPLCLLKPFPQDLWIALLPSLLALDAEDRVGAVFP